MRRTRHSRLALVVLVTLVLAGMLWSGGPMGVSAAPALRSVSASGSVTGGGIVTIKVTLTSAATSDTAVSIKSNRPSILTPPTQIVVPQGSSSASIEAETRSSNQQASVTIIARLGSITKTTIIIVKPPMLSSVSLPPSLMEGKSGNLTVRLNSKAPSGGMFVSIASNHASILPVVSPVKVPGGQTGVAVRVTAGSTSTTTDVIVTGSLNQVSKQDTVQVLDVAAPTPTATATATTTTTAVPPTATATATKTATSTSTATTTSVPPTATATNTVTNTATPVPPTATTMATSTDTPASTATETPEPTATQTPEPTETATGEPTVTNTPEDTATLPPAE